MNILVSTVFFSIWKKYWYEVFFLEISTKHNSRWIASVGRSFFNGRSNPPRKKNPGHGTKSAHRDGKEYGWRLSV